MTKILVSGFEPFGGDTINPSQLIVEGLVQRDLSPLRLAGRVLPTVFGRAVAPLLAAIDHFRPEAVVMMGVARGISYCRLELQATNRVTTRLADNDGVYMASPNIDPAGPSTRMATLDPYALQSALVRQQMPVTLSQDCGNYVCNYLYYQVLSELRSRGLATKALFVHVPPLCHPPGSTESQHEIGSRVADVSIVIREIGRQL